MTNSKSKILNTSTSTPTRNYGKDMLIYILRVFNLAEDSPLVQSLGIKVREDITSFLEISEHYIHDLEYFKDGTPTSVPKFQQSRVKVFFGYISYTKLQKNLV